MMDDKALEEIANRYAERFVFRGPETTPIRPFILSALREVAAEEAWGQHAVCSRALADAEAEVARLGGVLAHETSRSYAERDAALAKLEAVEATLTVCELDRLDAHEAKEAAEAEVERLRGALRDLLRDVDARLSLDSGFKGMGHNIATESAGKLRIDAEYARRVLLRGEKP